MSITDEIDELIPCGWLSRDEPTQLRAIPEFLLQRVLDDNPLFPDQSISSISMRRVTQSHCADARSAFPHFFVPGRDETISPPRCHERDRSSSGIE